MDYFDRLICSVLDGDLKVLKFLVSWSKSSSLFSNCFLVCLREVFFQICSIIKELASLLKIWFFITKWHDEVWIASALYTSLQFLLKSVSTLPTYCLGSLLHSKKQITKWLSQLTFWKIVNICPFSWLWNEYPFCTSKKQWLYSGFISCTFSLIRSTVCIWH